MAFRLRINNIIDVLYRNNFAVTTVRGQYTRDIFCVLITDSFSVVQNEIRSRTSRIR